MTGLSRSVCTGVFSLEHHGYNFAVIPSLPIAASGLGASSATRPYRHFLRKLMPAPAEPLVTAQPIVGIIMGSRSDWETMQGAANVLSELQIAHECRVVSAHRTPAWMFEYARDAASRGLKIIVAGAGGAAHLPGMVAASTLLPVLGVPVQSHTLSGLDSLLSIVQMPGGIPVGTLAIGTAGAKNAGLLAARILALENESLRRRLQAWVDRQTAAVLDDNTLPS